MGEASLSLSAYTYIYTRVHPRAVLALQVGRLALERRLELVEAQRGHLGAEGKQTRTHTHMYVHMYRGVTLAPRENKQVQIYIYIYVCVQNKNTCIYIYI